MQLMDVYQPTNLTSVQPKQISSETIIMRVLPGNSEKSPNYEIVAVYHYMLSE